MKTKLTTIKMYIIGAEECDVTLWYNSWTKEIYDGLTQEVVFDGVQNLEKAKEIIKRYYEK